MDKKRVIKIIGEILMCAASICTIFTSVTGKSFIEVSSSMKIKDEDNKTN